MPEVIVKYKNKSTLEALHGLARYFDFEISIPGISNKIENQVNLNGIFITGRCHH